MLEINFRPIDKMIEDYLQRYKEEYKSLKELPIFLQKKEKLNKTFQRGHITGSAWLINKDIEKY